MSKISPCLWFDRRAEEAATFYTSIIPDSRIDKVVRAAADNPSTRRGDVLTVDSPWPASRTSASTAGPSSRSRRRSRCPSTVRDQAEVDRYWEALTREGGRPGQCGWLKDRFGVSWQVVPRAMNEYLQGSDPEGAARAMEAMLKMTKLDVGKLVRRTRACPPSLAQTGLQPRRRRALSVDTGPPSLAMW